MEIIIIVLGLLVGGAITQENCQPPEPVVSGYTKDGKAYYADKEPILHNVCPKKQVHSYSSNDDNGRSPTESSVNNTNSSVATEPNKPTRSEEHNPPSTPSTPDQAEENTKSKSDNSDANGKGGNKHDRTDKDKPSQEIAENKKNK